MANSTTTVSFGTDEQLVTSGEAELFTIFCFVGEFIIQSFWNWQTYKLVRKYPVALNKALLLSGICFTIWYVLVRHFAFYWKISYIRHRIGLSKLPSS